MGKKRIIQTNQDELVKEKEKIEEKMKKDVNVKTSSQSRRGRIYVSSSYNNTIVTLTDENGNVLFSRGAGSIGFKGTKKGTSYAASQVAKAIVDVCVKLNVREADVYIKGVGGGRDMALKTLVAQGIDVMSVRDVTPIPHNGCRPKKPRRV